MPRSLHLRSITTLLMAMLISLAGCLPPQIDEPAITPTNPVTRTPSGNKGVTPTPGKRVKNTPGDFDFYVLSLSWSPDFCASNDDPHQCSLGRKLGFVLHGLWPQYNRGYPSDCSSVKLPKDAQDKFPNLYPNSALYAHEWDKHGTCSGLKPLEFLALSKSMKDFIALPQAYDHPAKAFRTTLDDLKAAFVDANLTLSKYALAVECSGSGRFLQELHVCFSREGQPIACSQEIQQDEAKSCGNADFLVRNVK